jgi:hypothetical protein
MRRCTLLTSTIATFLVFARVSPASDLRLSVGFDDGGAVTGTVSDATITCAGRQYRLSQVRSITLGPSPWIELADGARMSGSVAGLESLNPHFPVRLDIRQASHIDISAGEATSTDTGRPAIPLPGAPSPVTAVPKPSPAPSVTPAPPPPSLAPASTPQKMPTKSAPALSTPVRGSGPSNAPAVQSPALPPDTSPATKLALAAPANDAVLAAAGRYILLTLHDAKQLAVFDVQGARVVKSIPLSSDDATVTAGAEKLLIFSPGQQTLERWNLTTFQREKVSHLDPPEFTAVALGYLSRGPALVCRRPTQEGGNYSLCLLDVNTFKLTEIPYPGRVADMRLHASARGDLFAAASRDVSLSVRLADPLPRVGGLSPSIELFPSPDGYRFYGSNGTVYDADIGHPNLSQPPAVQGFASAASAIPTAWAGLYIIIKCRLDGPADSTARKLDATLYTDGRATPAAELPAMSEIEDLPQVQSGAPTFHNRIFLLPNSKRLITVASSTPTVYVRNIDVLDLMKRHDPNFLFVSSVPPELPRIGDLYRYSIQAQSGRGRVKFQLVNPPPDMRITPDGWVTWRASPLPNQDSAAVTITDAGGNSMNYVFPVLKPRRD